jgi:hypothetical protein
MTSWPEQPGGQPPTGQPNILRAATYRLLSRLGSVVRPQPPAVSYLDKRAALTRAIAAVPHPSVRLVSLVLTVEPSFA